MLAITPETQPTTVEPTAPTFPFALPDLYEALTIATRQHPALVYRLDRALSTVIRCPIERTGADAWLVGSLSRPGHWHRVQQTVYGLQCGCPDAVNRGSPCRHCLAVRLHRLAGHLARQRAVDAGVDSTARFVLTPQGEAALAATPELATAGVA